MGNTPIHQRMIRRLTQNSSGTVSVSIPLEHALALGWKRGAQVLVTRQAEHIVIKPISGKKRS